MKSVRSALRQALHWWLAGLARPIPEGVRALLGRQARIVAVLDGERLRLAPANGARGNRPAPSMTIAVGEQSREPLPRWLRRNALGRRPRVDLQLPAAVVMERPVTLPRAAVPDLRQVIAFEMDRLLPFRADALLFACTVESDLPGEDRVRVRLTATPRACVGPALDTLRGMGLVPVALTSSGGAPIPVDDRAGRSPSPRSTLTPILIGVNAILVLALTGAPLLRQTAEIESLETQVRQAERRAQVTDVLRRRLERHATEATALQGRRAGRPYLVELLDALSAALPQDTWVRELRVAGRDLSLRGASGSVERVVPAVSGLPALRDVRLRQAAPAALTGGYRDFDIAASLAAPAEP